MKPRLILLWDKIRSGYWFIPMLMTVASIGLSVLTIRIDRNIPLEWTGQLRFLWASGAEGARDMLATIASSMVTVAGVVFSITIVALTLASSQFGPRLLRNFMRDLGNQIVLGTFIATFLFCLLVLREIEPADNDVSSRFIPYISVTVGLLMALFSVGVLIYFIHHVADTIQVDSLVARVYQELIGIIDRLYPEEMGQDEREVDSVERHKPLALNRELRKPLPALRSGYIQSIDDDLLLQTTIKYDLVVKLTGIPGDFVLEGSEIAGVWSKDACPEKALRQIRRAVIIGNYRTPAQDVEFPVNQLVEIAMRALSPGINDPFTAVSCIEWISAALARLAARRPPSSFRYDKNNTLRIITRTIGFADLAEKSFSRIRQLSTQDPTVIIHMLEGIGKIAQVAYRQQDRDVLLQQAKLILEDSRRNIHNPSDLERIDDIYLINTRLLNGSL